MKIALENVLPNPNRDLKFNPYNEDKIAALIASINETGFWSNVIVRPHPTEKGKYQQAYGHHRTEAAKRCGIIEAEFVVQDLDENLMLKMMELENQEDYRYSPLSMLESVKAVVKALAEGRIAPFYTPETGEIDPKNPYKGAYEAGNKWKAGVTLDGELKYLGVFDTKEEAAKRAREHLTGKYVFSGTTIRNIRIAPSFSIPATRPEARLEAAYTAANIGTYLGRASKGEEADPKVRTALDALYLLEVKAITIENIKGKNWATLIRDISQTKARYTATRKRQVKTALELKKIDEENRRIQAEKKAKEKALEEERRALVKKLADAKAEEDRKKAEEALEKAKKKLAEDQRQLHKEYKEKKAEVEKKVQAVHEKEKEAEKQDEYTPVRKSVERLISIFERRDEQEEIKALARKNLKPEDRERLRQAALTKGEWYSGWVSEQFLPPLSGQKKGTKR